MTQNGFPNKQGLYDPRLEHDACGVGFVANISGEKSHQIIRMGLDVLVNLTHSGCGGSRSPHRRWCRIVNAVARCLSAGRVSRARN